MLGKPEVLLFEDSYFNLHAIIIKMFLILFSLQIDIYTNK